MKKTCSVYFVRLVYLSIFAIASLSTSAQQRENYITYLKSGVSVPKKNITVATIQLLNASHKQFDQKGYVIIQFEKIPSEMEKQSMIKDGIRLLEYIPKKAYVCEITYPLSLKNFINHKARAIIQPADEQKIDGALTVVLGKNAAEKVQKVMVTFYSTVDYYKAIELLKADRFITGADSLKDFSMVKISLPLSRLQQLAAFPFIQYIEKLAPPPDPLNFESRNNARANMVQTGLPDNYNLTGKGVLIGVDEVGGAPQPHVDFADRLIIGEILRVNDYHSTHVNGIVGGAGLINELYKGYAPKSTLFGTRLLNNFSPMPGMVLTNNSYATGGPCLTAPVNSVQTVYDKLAILYPLVQNVYAAGNSGTMSCNNGYPAGFNTVQGSQTSGKNTIAVGNAMKTGQLYYSSSKGPANGGRLKPDIIATGTNVISTIPVNGYRANTGTSMACPAVVGGLALMHQFYRQLHFDQYPQAALMKAIICNTANDAGNKGPDFSFGFGTMNVFRAIKAIESNSYFADAVANGEMKIKTIAVPSNTAQLKVLLYWQDPGASPISNRTLVNDLDITVTSPLGTINLPYTLDTLPANVANPATKGEDHINNVEQVVIDFPPAGNYSINIKGTEVGQNPKQEYFVTYDFLPNDVLLTFPFGNESIVPGENITIQWDSWGTGDGTFKLEFSPDNGDNWQLINASVAADKKQLDWQVPFIITTKALIKLTRNSDLKTSISGNFRVIGTPVISLSDDQCPGAIILQWKTVALADYYEVMKLEKGEMVVVDTTSSLKYIFRNLLEDSTYWVTARSVINKQPGRRAVALSRKPDNGTCIDAVFNNDLKASALISPLIGRQFTSTQFTQDQEIIFQIKNLDDQPVNFCTASYSVNNGNWVTEAVTDIIPANGVYLYHFKTRYDFSQPREYIVKLVVKNNTTDANAINDTLQYTVRLIPNAPLDLKTPFVENFEHAKDSVYTTSLFSMTGIEKFDYVKTFGTGKVSFSLNTASGSSGKSLQFISNNWLDFSAYDQFVVATLNLSNYDVVRDSLTLNFNLSGGGVPENNGEDSKLMIRGDDTKPWIEIMKFAQADSQIFNNKKIEVSGLGRYLSENRQNFSSSFQIKWSNSSYRHTYLLNNIILYNANNDMGISFADTLLPQSCNLGIQPLRVMVKNASRENASNIQVHYKINSSVTVMETIPFIAASSSILYTFNTPANLAAYGIDTIEIGVDFANDTYLDNNAKHIIIRNQPLINTFPYLQNFENGDGWWYTEGQNSSWQYGKPSSVLINKAASGDAAWKTNLAGNYNNSEIAYLYSPCINVSSLQNPMLSFSMALNTDSCATLGVLSCDFLRLQYTTDNINWASKNVDVSLSYNWKLSWSGQNYFRWHVVTMALPPHQGNMKFRFIFFSNDNKTFEGAAIDDIHIYDGQHAIYDTTLASSNIVQPIAGSNNWTDFLQDNKIIASINPNGQNLGNTVLHAFIKPIKPVSNFDGQYYLNRTFSLTAENKHLTDSVGVRLYYLDRESDSLLFARNCPACSKPTDAYRFGISQFTADSTATVNDNMSDNIKGAWSFIPNKNVKIVPFGKGYYAEFKVKELSEFRLNSGGPDKGSYLPVNILDFSATKTLNATTSLNWTVASEINIVRYEVEVAKGNIAFANNEFVKIGETVSTGATTNQRSYTFKDASIGKRGVLYYRLKAIDEFGNFFYSKSIPIFYSKELNWTIFPNPSNGLFTLRYQLSKDEKGTMKIYNELGQIVKTQFITGNGYIQTMPIDLSKMPFLKGAYYAKIITDYDSEIFKLLIR